ncbi:MAG: ABC transporter ATP-binding protein [Actinomycetota bacterium]|nr:ABC transporter ATP-binding protein [Actinomycetota bacterium]
MTQAADGRGGAEPLLAVEDLRVSYGGVLVLHGVSFDVRVGEVMALVGPNGAGKTTAMRAVSAVPELYKRVEGRIVFDGTRIDAATPARVARLGLAHVPEGRMVFPSHSVRDNLLLGAYHRGDDSEVEADVAAMCDRFPVLGERRDQPAGLLSGGEQQMLAMARGLMGRPKMLLLDEPSMGLAPMMVNRVFEIVEELRREGKTVLLVEQMALRALAIADRAAVLESGRITVSGPAAELRSDDRVRAAYLGGA